MKMSKFLAQNI